MNTFLERQEVRENRSWGVVLKRVERISLSVAIIMAGLAGLYGLYCLIFLGSYFRVDDIVLKGHWRHLDAPQLVERAGVNQGENLFMLDVESVHDRILSDAWVREVAVRRHLPNTLLIAVEEYEPVAVLVKPDGMYYVDANGEPFKMLESTDERNFAFITGITTADGAARDSEQDLIKNALDIINVFKNSALGRGASPAEVHYDSVVGFSIITERPSFQLIVGSGDVASRLERVSRATEAIRARGNGIRYILANEPGRVIVKYRDV